MLRTVYMIFFVLCFSGPGQADSWSDCIQYKDMELSLRGCNDVISRKDGVSKQDRAKAHYHRGSYYHVKGDWGRAVVDFTKSIELNAGNEFVYGRRGEAYLNQGHFELAIYDLTQAIDINPRYFMCYYNRGFAYAKLGDTDRAIVDFEKYGARFGPPTPGYYVARGNISALNGDNDSAISEFGKAIERQPKQYFAFRDRGLSYRAVGKVREANADFKKAREIRPGLWIPVARQPVRRRPKANQDHELSFWESVRDSGDRAMLQAYIDKYPNGSFVSLARIKLKKLDTSR